MPYSGAEVLKYLKNGTDTIIMKGEGVQPFYVNSVQSGGNCPQTYNMLHHKIRFSTSDNSQSLLFHHYIDGANGTFFEYFELTGFSNFQVGPVDVVQTLADPAIPRSSMTVLGVTSVVIPLTTNRNDSLYSATGSNPDYDLVRIRNGNDVYELILNTK